MGRGTRSEGSDFRNIIFRLELRPPRRLRARSRHGRLQRLFFKDEHGEKRDKQRRGSGEEYFGEAFY